MSEMMCYLTDDFVKLLFTLITNIQIFYHPTCQIGAC